MRVRVSIRLPYRLSVRYAVWLLWIVLVIAAMAVVGETSRNDHPLALFLFGLALAGTGTLAACTLCSPRVWERLVDSRFSVTQARIHLSWMIGLGLIGVALVLIALGQLA